MNKTLNSLSSLDNTWFVPKINVNEAEEIDKWEAEKKRQAKKLLAEYHGIQKYKMAKIQKGE